MRKPFVLESLEDDTKIKYDVPTNWNEVNTREYIALKKIFLEMDPDVGAELMPSDLLSAFSGIEKKYWKSMTPERYAEPYAAIMRFWNESPPMFLQMEVPDVIMLDGRFIKIETENPGNYAMGLVEAMMQRFAVWAKSGKIKNGTLDELVVFSSEVIALFCQQKFDGKGSLFDEEESKKLIPMIDELPAIQTIPIACFFLSESLQWWNNGMKTLNPHRIR